MHPHTLNGCSQSSIVRTDDIHLLDAKGATAEGETCREQQGGDNTEDTQQPPPKVTACSLPSTAIRHGRPALQDAYTSICTTHTHLSMSTLHHSGVHRLLLTCSLALSPPLREGIPGCRWIGLRNRHHTTSWVCGFSLLSKW